MRRFFHLLLVLGALMGANHCSHAQELNVLNARALKDQKSARVLVAPKNKNGSAVRGLSAAQFQATVAGKPAKIQSVEPTFSSGSSGMGVILLLDTSGSMAGQRWSAVRSAAGDFIKGLSADTQIAVITFDDAARTRLNFTRDKSVVRSVINKITPGSQDTTLYDAIDQARGLAGAIPLQKRVIVAVTDGRDNKSSLTAADIIALVNKGEVPTIYTLGIGRDVDDRTLERLARMSNGTYQRSNDAQGTAAMYRKVRSRLADAYLLHLAAPAIKDAQVYQVTWLRPNGARTSAQGVFGSTPGAGGDASNRRTLLILAGILLLAIAGIFLLRKPQETKRAVPLKPALDDATTVGVSESSTPRILPVPAGSGGTLEGGSANFESGFGRATGSLGGGFSGGFGPSPSGMGNASVSAERGTSVSGGEFGLGTSQRGAEATEIRRPDSASALAWLVATDGPMRSREFRIVKPEVVIGRGADADVRLSDDNRTSRHHAKLVQAQPGRFRIVDMASRNGLRVNGQDVTQAELQDEDVIEIGGSHLVFKSLGLEKG
jgi:Mg-chelatase subunit ChlD